MPLLEQFHDGQILFRYACDYGFDGIVSKRLTSIYASGPSRSWVKIKSTTWLRDNANRHKIFEKPERPPAPTEGDRALQRKRAELVREQTSLFRPGLRAGIKAALKAQETIFLQEIEELEAEEKRGPESYACETKAQERCVE